MIRLSVTIQGGRIDLDKRQTRAVFRSAGGEVAALARALIRRSIGGGRLYRGPGGSAKQYRGGYVAGTHSASLPGQPPASITGTLAQSIVVRPFKSGEGVAVRDTAFYALFLEQGSVGGGRGKKTRNRRGAPGSVRVLLPRPFLTAALEQRQATIASRIKASIVEGLKFKRMRA